MRTRARNTSAGTTTTSPPVTHPCREVRPLPRDEVDLAEEAPRSVRRDDVVVRPEDLDAAVEDDDPVVVVVGGGEQDVAGARGPPAPELDGDGELLVGEVGERDGVSGREAPGRP